MLVRVGTRKSKLALTQTEIITTALKKAHPELKFEIHGITTSGDKILDKDLALIGGKGLFLKEIEEELLSGNIDIAIHSMKDVPAFLPDGLVIDCIYKREVVSDVFVSHRYESIEQLPPTSVIGTSSLRRKLQLIRVRSDIKAVSFRGNVPTRIEKMLSGEVDGCLLAYAGLKRLGLEKYIKQVLPHSQFLPAVAQGAIGIERRSDDKVMERLLRAINDKESSTCVTAERAFMQGMNASCTTPIAAYAVLKDDRVHLEVQYFDPITHASFKLESQAKIGQEFELGSTAAAEIKKLCNSH